VGDAVHCAGAWDREHVYVPLAGSGLAALRWDTGAVVWSAALGEGVLTPPVVVGDRVLAATPDGGLHLVDAGSGDVVWTVGVEPQAEPRVTVVGPFAYLAGGAGGVRVFDVATGRRLAEIRSDVVVTVAVDPVGHLVLAGLDGTVTSLESPVTVH
jgi:outer membrane protein assembly factor BamB